MPSGSFRFTINYETGETSFEDVQETPCPECNSIHCSGPDPLDHWGRCPGSRKISERLELEREADDQAGMAEYLDDVAGIFGGGS